VPEHPGPRDGQQPDKRGAGIGTKAGSALQTAAIQEAGRDLLRDPPRAQADNQHRLAEGPMHVVQGQLGLAEQQPQLIQPHSQGILALQDQQ